jgi:predicted thioesterase
MVTEHVVTEQDTAATVGSGDLPVLATPTLATWFEMATVAGAADMVEDGQTTVGTLLAIEHLRPSPVGATVTIHCSMPARDGRRIMFQVRATAADGEDLATGKVHRAVVNAKKFMARCTTAE